MRILVLALLTVVLVPSLAFALNGRIVDHQGRPVADAKVYVLGRPGEAITDAEGRFTWQPDPTPPFEILVIDGAGTYFRPVVIQEIVSGRELLVTVAPLLNEWINVSGSAPSIEATPAAATTSLSGRDVLARQPANLVQAMENVAGISQVSEGQAAVPAIRGLARGRTLILIDGARVSSERRAGASASYLDPSVIESIDVARGPGSVAYGSDAFGGVISVRTRSVAPRSPWAAQLSGTFGAGVPERRGAIEMSKGVANGGFLFAAHARRADDWRSPAEEILNSGFSDRGFLFRAEHKAGAGRLSAGWQSDFGRDIGRPRDNSRTVRFFYPTEDSHRLTVGYDARDLAGWRRVNVTAFVGRYAQVTEQDRFATSTAGRLVERAGVSARDFHVRGFGERVLGTSRFELGLDVHGRFGLHALDSLTTFNLGGDVVNTQSDVSVDTASRADTGAHLSIDTPVAPRLILGAGLRGDYVTTKNVGGHFGERATRDSSASGFASATFGSFRGFSLTGQIARGFRDPALSDRYYRGPTGRGVVTGNPALAPETSIQGDFAVRYVSRRYRVGLFYYDYRIDHLIERYSTDTDVFFFRNRGRARLRGFEVEGHADLWAGVSLDAAAQVAAGRALDNDTYLDDISPISVSAVLRKQHGERSFAQVRVAYFSDDEHAGPTERAVPGYALVDVSGGIRIGAPLELRVQARNLFDQEYYASQDVRTVFAPGRSVSLVTVVKF